MSNIPLPGSWANALFEGVQERNKNKQSVMQNLLANRQLEQQHAHHGENLLFRQLQQQALAQQFAEQQALRQETENRRRNEFNLKKEQQPLKLSLLEAKIKAEQENAETLKKYGSIRPTAAVQEADILFDRND